MGSDASYNERRLLWKAVRLVWAVTGMRRTPRPANTAGAGGPARIYAAHKGAEVPMGSGALYRAAAPMESGMLCLGCNWHEKNPAPHGREEGAGSACPHARRAESLWEGVRPIMSGGSYAQRYALCKL